MLRVAAHRRTDPRRLYRRAAFAWLCVEFLVLVERARDTALARDAARLHMARLVNLAVCAPERLADEQRALAERAGPVESRAEAVNAGLAMLARGMAAQAQAAGWQVMPDAEAPAGEGA